MANPGLWFYGPTLWRYSSCANWEKTFSLSLPPFSWHSRGCPTELSNQLCADFSFPVKRNSCTSRFIGKKKNSADYLQDCEDVKLFKVLVNGSQCYAQNWVSLSRLSCSREHTHGEVKECFSQAVHLSGNADFHFDTFEEVNTFI